MSIITHWGQSYGSYTYDAWGNVLSVSGDIANLNPIRYRGYYYDSETRLYYLGSRYYDPQVKRFINADAYASTGQGFIGYNAFAYCLNNPVALIDYNGSLATEAIAGGIIGAITGGIWGGITAAASGGNVAKGVFSGIASGAVSGALSSVSKPIAMFVGAASSLGAYLVTSNNRTVSGAIVAATLGAANAAVSSTIQFSDVGIAGTAVSSYVIGGATSVLSMIGTTIADSNRINTKAPSASSTQPTSTATVIKPMQKRASKHISKNPSQYIAAIV